MNLDKRTLARYAAIVLFGAYSGITTVVRPSKELIAETSSTPVCSVESITTVSAAVEKIPKVLTCIGPDQFTDTSIMIGSLLVWSPWGGVMLLLMMQWTLWNRERAKAAAEGMRGEFDEPR